MQNKVIVVTGGVGFLGTAVVRLLAERGATVAVIDKANPKAIPGAALVLGNLDLTNPGMAISAMAPFGKNWANSMAS